MKLQFVHNRELTFKNKELKLLAKGGETIAMEEIPLDMFREITNEHILSAHVGKALCSKKDNYSKKIGREIAIGRLKELDLEVDSIQEYMDHNDREIREVVLVEPGTSFRYLLQHKSGNDKVHFIQYER